MCDPLSLVDLGAETSEGIVHTKLRDVEDALQVQGRVHLKLLADSVYIYCLLYTSKIIYPTV